MSSYALRLPESPEKQNVPHCGMTQVRSFLRERRAPTGAWDALKKAAKRIAAADDTTMNQFFVVAIAEKISAMETADFFQKRAALGNPQAAQSAWDKVCASSALPEDHWGQIEDDPSR